MPMPMPMPMPMLQSVSASNVLPHKTSQEVELKLLLAPSDAPAFRAAVAARLPLEGTKPRVSRLHTTYFDTDDLTLRAQHIELRIRRHGQRWVETLKTAEPPGTGLYRRGEWEAPVAGLRPALVPLCAQLEADSPWCRALSEPGLAERLVPVFEASVRRSLWKLSQPDGSRIEMTLDEGELRCGDRRAPICEVEFEVKAGKASALFDMALQLQDAVPLRLGHLGKADRGYALNANAHRKAVVAQPVELPRGVSIEQGLRIIARNCLAQVWGNEDGVIEGTDPEDVHQMRVGVRRLRSALRLFARAVPTPALLGVELRWLSAELGAARDTEVFSVETLPSLTVVSGSEAQWTQLLQTASTSAQRNRQRSAQALASHRYARLSLSLAAWLECSEWRAAADKKGRKALRQPLRPYAFAVDQRLHHELRVAGKGLARARPEQRHRARIAAKRLRYATDFFRSLYSAKSVKRYIKRLAALQDVLGQLNDAMVAKRLFGELVEQESGLASAAAAAGKQLDDRTTHAMPEVQKRWKDFRHSTL